MGGLGLSLDVRMPRFTSRGRTPAWAGTAKFWRDFVRNIGSVGDPPVTSSSTRYAQTAAEDHVPIAPNTPARTDAGLNVAPPRTRLHGELALAGGANGGSALILPTEGAWSPVRVVSAGADWHRRRVTGLSVTSGTAYGVRCRYRAGTSGKAVVAVGVAGVQSTLRGAYGNLSLDGPFAGPVTIIAQRQLANGDYELEASWTPNATGSTGEIGVGPYSANADEYVDVIGVELVSSPVAAGFPGSWILGGAGSVTLDADRAIYPFSGRVDPTSGLAIVVTVNILQPAMGSSYNRLLSSEDANNGIYVYYGVPDQKLYVMSRQGGLFQGSVVIGNWTRGRQTIAIAVSNNYVQPWRVGDAVPAAKAAGAPYPNLSGLTSLGLGGGSPGNYTPDNCHSIFEKIAVFDGLMDAARWEAQIKPAAIAMAAAA